MVCPSAIRRSMARNSGHLNSASLKPERIKARMQHDDARLFADQRTDRIQNGARGHHCADALTAPDSASSPALCAAAAASAIRSKPMPLRCRDRFEIVVAVRQIEHPEQRLRHRFRRTGAPDIVIEPARAKLRLAMRRQIAIAHAVRRSCGRSLRRRPRFRSRPRTTRNRGCRARCDIRDNDPACAKERRPEDRSPASNIAARRCRPARNPTPHAPAASARASTLSAARSARLLPRRERL